MHHIISPSGLSTVASALTATLLAMAPAIASAQSPNWTSPPVVPPVVNVCLRPYEYRGTAYIRPGYSGDATNFSFSGGRYLRVDSIRAWLAQPGFRGADLGGWTDGEFSWTSLQLDNGVATYDWRRDGRRYLDSAAFGKLILYRNNGNGLGIGGIEVKGCMVNVLPRPVVLPPDIDDVPRLPPRRLEPGDTVMQSRPR